MDTAAFIVTRVSGLGVLQRNADIFESNIKVRIRQKAEFQRRKMVG